jgi:1-deoxy-D-xylulose-5-phosphate synthase
MVIMAPADENECRMMLSTGFHYAGPAAIRYPRGTGTGAAIHKALDTLPIGKAEMRRRGHGLAILSFGAMLAPATEIAAEMDATLVNMRFVKPLDEAMIVSLAKTHDAFVTLEDNAVAGGAGSGVAECLAAHGIVKPILHLGLPDSYLEHGSREEVLTMAGLDLPSIRTAIRARFPQLADRSSAALG